MLTVGGDQVHYPGEFGMLTVALQTVKILLNSVISTPGAIYMNFDIKDFYLDTLTKRSDYMRLKPSDLTKDFIKKVQTHC